MWNKKGAWSVTTILRAKLPNVPYLQTLLLDVRDWYKYPSHVTPQ